MIGGGNITEEKRNKARKQQINFVTMMKQYEREIGDNFGKLDPNAVRSYGKLAVEMSKISAVLIPHVI